jgi:hypothetical protein
LYNTSLISAFRFSLQLVGQDNGLR